MTAIKHILVASDFSKASHRAFRTAVDLAKLHRARLTILHVHIPLVPLVPEQYIDSPKWAAVDGFARAAEARQLEALARRAESAGVRTRTRYVSGEPSRDILRAARALRPDMLVIGTHGRTGFSRFLMGSVAERVAATAKCPVLTVRG